MTPKQQLFVLEYLKDLNSSQAMIRAGYSPRTAGQAGFTLLKKVEVQKAIAAAMAARTDRVKVDIDAVVRELQTIALADPRELTEYRRLCCRYCHGAGFRYQRTAGEMERDRASYDENVAKSKKKGAIAPFDEKGGIGFHAKKDPHKDCPECFGDGVGNVFINDTRKLSVSAAKLFAGVKRTKDGIEVMTRDQDSATINLGRHVGAFKDRLEVKDVTDRAAALDRARKRVEAARGR